jgi:Putative zinc-finger
VNGLEPHRLLGAYLLGGLERADIALFEQHLDSCAECRGELDDLASLPALLDAVPVNDALALTGAAAAVVPVQSLPEAKALPAPKQLLDELAARRRRVRRRWSAAVAVAAAACLAVGVLAGPLLSPPAKPDASYSVQTGEGLQFTVGLVKKTWGTELAVDGRSLPADGTFSLWVKDRDGGEDRACAWTATPSGRVRITGATPVQLASIASVEMRNGQQQTVAVVAVPRG